MIHDYIEAALRRAHYELIDDEDPYYGAVPGLQGRGQAVSLWKSAAITWRKSLRVGCCSDSPRGLTIPPLGEATVVAPKELAIA